MGWSPFLNEITSGRETYILGETPILDEKVLTTREQIIRARVEKRLTMSPNKAKTKAQISCTLSNVR